MPSAIPESSLTLFDYWRIIWRFRRMIAAVVVVSVLVTGIVSKLSPKLYEASATLLPVPPDSMGGGMSFGGMGGKDNKGGGGGGGGSMALDLLGGKSTGPSFMDSLMALLGSRLLAERVIDRLNLMQYYGVTSKPAAISALRGEFAYHQTMHKTVELTVSTRDPKVAADIANTYVSALDSAYREIPVTSARKNRMFIEARLAERVKKLSEAENALIAFQKENRILDPLEQMGGNIGVAAELHGQILGLEVELAALREYATPSHPDINKLEVQITELRKQLDRADSDRARMIGAKQQKRTTLSKKVYPVFEEAPSLGFEFLRLARQQKVEEAVYGMLIGMLESAKLAELRDVPTVHLLDAAVPPEFKSRPKTLHNVLMAAAISLVSGILLAFLLVHLEQLRAQDIARRQGSVHGTGIDVQEPNGNGKPEDAAVPVVAKPTSVSWVDWAMKYGGLLPLPKRKD